MCVCDYRRQTKNRKGKVAAVDMKTISGKGKQRVLEITDRLEEGFKELFEREKYKNYLNTHRWTFS